MNGLFRDRAEAGQVLAPKLRECAHRVDVIVLALAPGGVPVAFEVARKLHAPLDVLVVRELSVPGREELKLGAIASGGLEFRNEERIAALQISPAEVEAEVQRERAELERRDRAYRRRRPFPSLGEKTVIIVDDGIATGATLRAALRTVQTQVPREVVIAAPIAARPAADLLRSEGAPVVTVVTPERVATIGEYYRDFHPVTAAEVKDLLVRGAAHSEPRTAAA